MSSSRTRAGLWLAFLLAGCAGSKKAPESAPAETSGAGAPSLAPLEACTPTGPEACEDALDDNCNGVIDEGCGGRTGLLQFVIAWDKVGADVDLRVIDPNGELVEVGRPTESGLIKERDCPGRNSECRGKNTENVFLEEGEPLRGEYRTRVRLESLGGETPPIFVRFGARLGQKTYAAGFSLPRPESEREFVLGL